MTDHANVDLSKLIGFDQLTNTSAATLDLSGDAFGAKLGAKRADVEAGAVPSKEAAAA